MLRWAYTRDNLPEMGFTILTKLLKLVYKAGSQVCTRSLLPKQLFYHVYFGYLIFRARFIAAFIRGPSVWKNKAFVQRSSVFILRAQSAFTTFGKEGTNMHDMV